MKIKLAAILSLVIMMLSCEHAAKAEISTKHLEDRIGQRSFTLFNHGNSDLVIEDFTSSCECTVMNMKKGSIIVSGDSLVVPVEINKDNQDKDRVIFISILSNAKPRLISFKFEP